MTSPDDRIAQPVPVTVTNWAPPVKPPFCKNTTVRTIVVDPANGNQNNYLQVSDYEPNRLRLALVVIDADVMITTDPPTTSGVASTTAVPGNGGVLPKNSGNDPYEFFGPDAFWINSLATITRVTVIKEYS